LRLRNSKLEPGSIDDNQLNSCSATQADQEHGQPGEGDHFWIFDFSSALRVLSNYQRPWFFTMRLDWRKLSDKGMRGDSDLIRSVMLQHSTTRAVVR
jgi:hypothetical protein